MQGFNLSGRINKQAGQGIGRMILRRWRNVMKA
jgi:hypothetical protein